MMELFSRLESEAGCVINKEYCFAGEYCDILLPNTTINYKDVTSCCVRSGEIHSLSNGNDAHTQ